MSCEKCSAVAAEHFELISGGTYLEKIWLSPLLINFLLCLQFEGLDLPAVNHFHLSQK